MMTTQDILKQCTIEGNNVKLPAIQLDRKQYMDVAKSLEIIGGKWKGGKISAFVFATDPTELLTEIQGGEKRNLKKEFQFFGTPSAVADKIVKIAMISSKHSFLEPSAGQGAIVEAINRSVPNTEVDCFELMPLNATILAKNKNANIIGSDFLKEESTPIYDRIIANPPFNKNQDIDHIKHMFKFLAEGGRIVSVASKHWESSTNKKETEFREWLENIGAVIEQVPAGAFKESGTKIATCIIIIDKKQQNNDSRKM